MLHFVRGFGGFLRNFPRLRWLFIYIDKLPYGNSYHKTAKKRTTKPVTPPYGLSNQREATSMTLLKWNRVCYFSYIHSFRRVVN